LPIYCTHVQTFSPPSNSVDLSPPSCFRRGPGGGKNPSPASGPIVLHPCPNFFTTPLTPWVCHPPPVLGGGGARGVVTTRNQQVLPFIEPISKPFYHPLTLSLRRRGKSLIPS